MRRADQIELVDMTPEALRRRMAHGNIYAGRARSTPPSANYFRPGNLGALRELALLWVADQVDEALEEYRDATASTDPWETRERVVVAITGAPGGEQLIRRAARMAGAGPRRAARRPRPRPTTAWPAPAAASCSTRTAQLLDELGGTYHEVVGADVGRRPGRLRPGRERHPDRARRHAGAAGGRS